MPIVILKSPPSGFSDRIDVKDEVKIGGEGSVYFSKDGKYAVKIYHQPHNEKEKFLQYVMTLFQSLPHDQEKFILPPLSLIDSINGQKRIGFIMRKVPDNYRELADFMLAGRKAAHYFKQGKTWAHYLKIARSVANSIVVLHGKGCAHSDIHYLNFLANIDEGDAIMLEIDGVVVPGFLPPQVKGMLGFMAPEIVTDTSLPDEKTDRYSLAVLILHILLFRNVMQPLVDYDSDPNKSEELGWGKYALFSEDPDTHRHRPRNLGLPFYHEGSLSYRILTPALQKLTEKVLIASLRIPGNRPSSREWEEALAYAIDELWMCSVCGQYFPYPYWLAPVQRRVCPFCGEKICQPYPLVLELYEEKNKHNFIPIGRRIVVGHNYKIFEDVIEPSRKPPFTRKDKKSVGHIEWDRKKNRYHLINDEGGTWQARHLDGNPQFTARRGQSLVIEKNFYVNFGKGYRMAFIIE